MSAEDEQGFNQYAEDLLFLLRRFGQNRGMSDRQTVALTLYATSLAIKSDVKENGTKSAMTFKRGLKSTIQEIDDIVKNKSS